MFENPSFFQTFGKAWYGMLSLFFGCSLFVYGVTIEVGKAADMVAVDLGCIEATVPGLEQLLMRFCGSVQ